MTDSNTTTNPYADIVDTIVSHPDAINASVESKGGGFDDKPPRAGAALLRLRSYIERGRHEVKKGMGKGKKQLWADLEFELVHPDHMKGPDDNRFPDTIRIRNLNVSMNKKATYFKLFKLMNYNQKYTSFSQMLGHAFLGEIFHNKSGDTIYANLNDEDGVYHIGAPVYNANTDPLGEPEIKAIPVPELYGEVQLFTWENPGVTAEQIQLMWDRIEITGEKADGTPKKNWIQEDIRSNLDWEGSFTQSVVGGSAIVAADVADEVSAATDATTQAASDDTTTEAEATPAADATAKDPVDPLADIPGL